jgi:hypothetical protein
MEHELLKVLKDELKSLGLNYEYGEYTSELKYPYIVGEYNESNFAFENGGTNGEIILTIFTRGSESELINIKEAIKNHFGDFRKMSSNTSVYISYRNKLFIRSGEANLKKMEVYLDTTILKGAN